MIIEPRTSRHRYGFSTTGKLHKIYKQQVGIRSNRGTWSHCGTTGLHNLQNDGLETEKYDRCKTCFGIKKKPPVTLLTTLRKNDPDRLSWIQRMGIPIR